LGKAFAPTLKKAFEHMAKLPGQKTKQSLLRILKIWKERGIYEAPLMDDFQKTYLTTWDNVHGEDVKFDYIAGIATPLDLDSTGNASESGGQELPSTSSSSKLKLPRSEEKKRDSSHSHMGGGEASQRKRKSGASKTVDEWETDGFVQLEVSKSHSRVHIHALLSQCENVCFC